MEENSGGGIMEGATQGLVESPYWLPFQRQCFSDLLNEDGLAVMGRGLGINKIVAKFIRLSSNPESLVFVLNGSGVQAALFDILASEGVPENDMPKVITTEFTAEERKALYMDGGVFFITSRILIVDLLRSRVDPSLITGFLVLDAHRVTDTSTETFILRIFRQANKKGFTRAFTDNAESLVSGFNKIEKVMRFLFIRQVFLYPRFHLSVVESFQLAQPEVVEVAQPLTKRMQEMQSAILVAMETCLAELRRCSGSLLDTADLQVEAGLLKSFDLTIRRQLDPHWHKVSFKTKGIVNDLGTLRKLLSYLLRYDCITFHSFLDNLRVSNSQLKNPSLWMFTAAAEKLFALAKERLYCQVGSHGDMGPSITSIDATKDKDASQVHANSTPYQRGASGSDNGQGQELDLTLEENPKWKLLDEILQEIVEEGRDRSDLARQRAEAGRASNEPAKCEAPSGQNIDTGAGGIKEKDASSHSATIPRPERGAAPGCRVLIIVRDARTAAQLREFLQLGAHGMLSRRFYRYLVQYNSRKRKVTQSKATSASISLPGGHPPSSSHSLSHRNAFKLQEALFKLEEKMRVELGDPFGATSMAPSPSGTSPAGRRACVTQKGGRQRETKVKGRKIDATSGEKLFGSKKRTSPIESEGAKQFSSTANQEGPTVDQHSAGQGGMSRTTKKRKKVLSAREKEEEFFSGVASYGLSTEELDMIATQEDQRVTLPTFLEAQAAKGVNSSSSPFSQSPLPHPLAPSASIGSAPASEARAAPNLSCSNKSVTSTSRPAASSPSAGAPRNASKVQLLDQFSIVLYAFEEESDREMMLEELRPSYVILYDPEISIVRELEVYQARFPNQSLRIFFLLYEESVEEQKYLSELKREKEAFETLIRQKAHLLLPERYLEPSTHQEWREEGGSQEETNKRSSYSLDTRSKKPENGTGLESLDSPSKSSRGRRKAKVKAPPTIIVDIREFRSALPSLLHQQGQRVLPVSIEVGDYILSPHICVERKSVSDLFGSFASGRLYNQAENMSRYYTIPTLLIEFSSDKSFSLQATSDIPSDISSANIISKLVLLTMHFPQLRIVWSRSPHATVDIFKSLKFNQEEPDLASAVAAGGEEEPGVAPRQFSASLSSFSSSVAHDDASQSSSRVTNSAILNAREKAVAAVLNTTAQDMVRHLPGVSEYNYRSLLQQVDSLADLATMSCEELGKLIGKQGARQLYAFLHKSV